MTPRQENEIALLVGRMAGQIEGMQSTLESLVTKADQAVDWRHEVKDRLEKMETQGIHMNQVASAFEALQKAIHEGGIQARAYTKGVLLGVGIAAGGAGAFIASGIKWIYAVLWPV